MSQSARSAHSTTPINVRSAYAKSNRTDNATAQSPGGPSSSRVDVVREPTTSTWAVGEEGEEEYSHEIEALLGGIKKPKKKLFPADSSGTTESTTTGEGEPEDDDEDAGNL